MYNNIISDIDNDFLQPEEEEVDNLYTCDELSQIIIDAINAWESIKPTSEDLIDALATLGDCGYPLSMQDTTEAIKKVNQALDSLLPSLETSTS